MFILAEFTEWGGPTPEGADELRRIANELQSALGIWTTPVGWDGLVIVDERHPEAAVAIAESEYFYLISGSVPNLDPATEAT